MIVWLIIVVVIITIIVMAAWVMNPTSNDRVARPSLSFENRWTMAMVKKGTPNQPPYAMLLFLVHPPTCRSGGILVCELR